MWRAGEGWLIFVTAVVLLATTGLAVSPSSEEPFRYSISFISGSMFVSDAGTSHGGFEMNVEYTLELSPTSGDIIYTGSRVVLEIKHRMGLGDPVYPHSLEMKISYDTSEDAVILEKAKTRLRFVYVEQDDIWGHRYDDHYIASWGGYAPAEEIRGFVTPVFFELPDHYYVEMRFELVITPVA